MQAVCRTPTIPVGPSYVVSVTASLSISAASDARPVIETGCVCGTSASSAPIVTTSCVPSASARSMMFWQNVFQRIDGSGPCTRMRSRWARGTRAAKISMPGHVISRLRSSVKPMCGRVD